MAIMGVDGTEETVSQAPNLFVILLFLLIIYLLVVCVVITYLLGRRPRRGWLYDIIITMIIYNVN